MKAFVLIVCVICNCFSISCNSTQQPSNKASLPNDIPQFTLKAIKIDSGWGYDIYLYKKVFIHQPIIPAVTGNKKFKSKKQALKTGKLMLYKIKHNISPPSISLKELDSLGVDRD